MIIRTKYEINKKKHYAKNRDKLLQKQNEYRNRRNTVYKDLAKSYVEIQNKIKALEEKLKINNSEKTLKYLLTRYIQNHQKRIMQQTKLTFIISMTFGLLTY